ncbi:peptidoglycan recognition protein family protein [Streptomyces sp. NBC_00271]|uniref:peptidoglycan recognition protein family protein n=1 Tax=Streptomyces sp. NBC_00271 TaxID=2975697 RepID=UPI002E297CAC|nr:peptidoglycan recognition family protein [Streptomyces sp. NBC_00271]
MLYTLGGALLTPIVVACGSSPTGASPNDANPKQKRVTQARPKTQVLQSSSPTGSPQRTNFPITAVGISWTGAQRGIRIRFYDKSGATGAWEAVRPGCPCGKDAVDSAARAENTFRAIVSGHDSFGYQIDAASDVHLVNAVAIDAGILPGLAIAGPRESPQQSAPPTKSGLDFPPANYLTRADWGANESKRFEPDGRESSPTRFFPLQAVTVHHTVTANNDRDPAATVRAIYELHTTGNKWGDIGYHFLIDRVGRIYEGRWSGKDGVPAHDRNGNVVTAFHTAGFNSGNLGIALLGDFRTETQTPAMSRSLTQLVASVARKHDLDPRAAITYRNPLDGRRKRITTLAGHRDWIPTECPGATAHEHLSNIRQSTARLLSGGRSQAATETAS